MDPFGFGCSAFAYWQDALERSVLYMDVMRHRGNQYLEHIENTKPNVLRFETEMLVDGHELPRPINYELLRILPPAGIKIDPLRRPFVVVDPRAGHGPGIGGFKPDSEIGVALRAGADVSVTVRADPKVKAAIAAIDQTAWTAIEYREAVFDQDTGTWVSRAEIDFTAFAAQKRANRVPGRLVVRRIPDLNARPGQGTLFDTWRFHAFFTTVPAAIMDTVTADRTNRGHAIIEQVHADLKNAALAHLPSVIWSPAMGVHHVHEEGCLLSGVPRGCDYLPLSMTATEGVRCEYNACSCQVLGSSPGRCWAMTRSRSTVPGVPVIDRAFTEHGQGLRSRPEGLVHLP